MNLSPRIWGFNGEKEREFLLLFHVWGEEGEREKREGGKERENPPTNILDQEGKIHRKIPSAGCSARNSNGEPHTSSNSNLTQLLSFVA